MYEVYTLQENVRQVRGTTPAQILGHAHIFVPSIVMPAKAGIQGPHIKLLAELPLGPRFRGDDD